MSLRVLVVDDSAFVRQRLARLLGAAGMEVVGTARDGNEAVARAQALAPDVVTMDVEMPGGGGLEAVRALLRVHPVPVVMVSARTTQGAAVTVEALAAGAVDFVPKPVPGGEAAFAEELVRKVRAAARAVVGRRAGDAPARPGPRPRRRYGLVVIGCSTGGPQALAQVVPALPADLPAPVLVVQHMPPGFTAALAARLDRAAALRVREAAPRDRLEPGVVLVAAGGHHLVLGPAGRVTWDDGPPEHGVRPAVDVTLRSVVRVRGGDAAVAILTGMGMDGAAGARLVRQAGGYVVCEAEATAVVWGMPRATWELGAAEACLPLPAVAPALVQAVSGPGGEA